MELTCSVGAVNFRFARVEHRADARFEGQPFILLPDGTEVRRLEMKSRDYLVVDHRPDIDQPARVEYWETMNAPETPLSGLLVICDAIPAG